MIRLDRSKVPYEGDPGWYLYELPELKHVTFDSSNENVGIVSLRIFWPNDAQEKKGIVAIVTVESLLGDFQVTIFRSRKDSRYLYLKVPELTYSDSKKEQQIMYKPAINLNRKAVAQILRFVHSNSTLMENESEMSS